MTYVLKLGGGAGVDHTAVLENLAARIQRGEQWVLVHGASDAANRLGEDLGYPAQMIITPGGHTSRYTDARTLEIYCEAAASVNESMTSALTQQGIDAVGLSDANVVRARRKTAIRAIRNGRQVMIRDDFSGSIHAVEGHVLESLLADGVTPVVAPVALGDDGERLNVDGDLAAAMIARELNAEALIILSNVPGLLRDVDDLDSLIDGFDVAEMAQYEDYAQGRMKKKVMAAERAEVERVILADSRVHLPLDAALNGAGTQITNRAVERALAV
jgi:acetylglutamate/LysW-gamma-L-alpha-aminoadipate kinase